LFTGNCRYDRARELVINGGVTASELRGQRGRPSRIRARARVVPRAGDASARGAPIVRRESRARGARIARSRWPQLAAIYRFAYLPLMRRRRALPDREELLARTRGAAQGAERKNAGRAAASDRSVGEVIVEVIDQPPAEVSARPGSSCSGGAVSHRSTELAVDHRSRYTYRAGEDTRAGTRACIQGGRELRHRRQFPSFPFRLPLDDPKRRERGRCARTRELADSRTPIVAGLFSSGRTGRATRSRTPFVRGQVDANERYARRKSRGHYLCARNLS